MVAELFRFASVRPPQLRSSDGDDVISLFGPNGTTPLRDDLAHLAKEGAPRSSFVERARRFLATGTIQRVVQADYPPIALRTAATARTTERFVDLRMLVQRLLSRSPSEAASSSEHANIRAEAADAILALCLAHDAADRLRADAMSVFRTLAFIEYAARTDIADNLVVSRNRVWARVVTLPHDLFTFPVQPPEGNDARARATRDRNNAELGRRGLREQLVKQLDGLAVAIDAFRQAWSAQLRASAEPQANDAVALHAGAPPGEAFRVAIPRPAALGLSGAMIATLPESIVSTLGGANALKDVEAVKVIGALEQQRAQLARTLFSTVPNRMFMTLGGRLVDPGRVFGLLTPDGNGLRVPGMCVDPPPGAPSTVPTVPAPAAGSSPVGIADLMIVRQKLRGYRLGEIAHVENVLRGEARQRRNRRTHTVQQTTMTEQETTSVTERDLESTQRFELQRESQQTLSEDSSLAAGLTVNAKYGPFVEVSASGNYAHSDARQESARSASSYAQNIVDRSVTKLTERTLTQRIEVVTDEFEEVNKHGFDNHAGTEHIVGVYRWIDKLYTAQVVNYGRRLLFEFVIPEPAAFWRYAQTVAPVSSDTLTKPIPPGYCDETTHQFVPLQPGDITESNYPYWVTKYGATDATAPPPRYRIVGQPFTHPYADGPRDPIADSSKEVTVPQGYVATYAYMTGNYAFVDGSQPALLVYTGQRQVPCPLSEEDGIVPIAILAKDIVAYAFNIEVLCERSQATFEQWQLKTYASIMSAFEAAQADYDEKVSEARSRRDILGPRGTNPLRNRDVEQTELRKHCVSLLSRQQFDLFDAVRRDVPPYGYPEPDLDDAIAEGRYLQFFEQAFEWELMAYIFYPYFWGKKSDWATVGLLDDDDPLFAQFLRAGAARVQVPVRPGYEEALLYYVESGGVIWRGGDPPHIGDPLFVSLVDEIRGLQGQIGAPATGQLAVTNGATEVTGTNTDFSATDAGREIVIAGTTYVIAGVSSATQLSLTVAYAGPTASSLPYSLGPLLVGNPWEVVLPTTLVMLQQDAQLPEWTD